MSSQFRSLLMILLVLAKISGAQSQTTSTYRWWNPATNDFPCIEGQAWPGELKGTYFRMPARAENRVRKRVWDLSHNSAGLAIRFTTNSPEIIVKYKVGGGLSLPHMPSTGVSGVDLYGVGKDGGRFWCKGAYSFGDTIVYTFKNFTPLDSLYPFHEKGGEFKLYLPLYNTVSWMNIGVAEGYDFTPLPLRNEKPVVVYGTSIAQGACASRPGMAWTAIAGRVLDRPLINLGFSGNGVLEKGMIDLCAEIDAKIFALDCLPNLTRPVYAADTVRSRLLNAVAGLRKLRPSTPILLVEHAGYGEAGTDAEARHVVNEANRITEEVFKQIKAAGDKQIFLLTKDEIGLDESLMVDGTHPTDGGMLKQATAFENKVRAILNEPVGKFSTTKPCKQNRDADMYDWNSRHNAILALNAKEPPPAIFIGNSITHYWAGEPEAPLSRGKDSWDKFMAPHGMRNLGFGWDRIENVLWRVYHDELDGYSAKQIVLLIGTNNLSFNTDNEIVEGLRSLVAAIRYRQPKSAILVLGILPRAGGEKRIAKLNKSIALLAKSPHVTYSDPSLSFLGADGKINRKLFIEDGLHPGPEGYRTLGKLVAPLLAK